MKLIKALKKEILLLLNDKSGLLLMFLMPLILVLVITIVQDSAFKMINENKVSLIIFNEDLGEIGGDLTNLLAESPYFDLEITDVPNKKDLLNHALREKKMAALYIPYDFSERFKNTSLVIAENLSFGLDTVKSSLSEGHNLELFYDPVLSSNYSNSIFKFIEAKVLILQNRLLISDMSRSTGIDIPVERVEDLLSNGKVVIKKGVLSSEDNYKLPNSTQHNIPAWSIFAIFFMVTSLGSNIVEEKSNGSFLRLKTTSTSFYFVLVSKVLTYLFAAHLQFLFIFLIGKYFMPVIGLPPLTLSSSWLLFIIMIFLSSLSAVSFSLLIGSFSKTQAQVNGFGAFIVVIFAAIGGIWVPSFAMPEYLQNIGLLSPLYWCLEGFYIIFLKSGDITLIMPVFTVLISFILLSQIATYIKLKVENII